MWLRTEVSALSWPATLIKGQAFAADRYWFRVGMNVQNVLATPQSNGNPVAISKADHS